MNRILPLQLVSIELPLTHKGALSFKGISNYQIGAWNVTLGYQQKAMKSVANTWPPNNARPMHIVHTCVSLKENFSPFIILSPPINIQVSTIV